MTTSSLPRSIADQPTMKSAPAMGRLHPVAPIRAGEDHAKLLPSPDWVAGYRRGLIVTDVIVVGAVVFTSQTLRFTSGARVFLDGFGSINYWIISTLLTCLWLAALGIYGAWDRGILGAGPSEYSRIIRASFYLFGFVAIVSYLTMAEIGRSYLAIALPLGLFGLFGGRWVWRRLLEEYRRTGTHLSAVVVVGGTLSSVALAARLRNTPGAGFRVAGLCLPGGPAAWSGEDDAIEHGFPVVGDLTDVAEAIARTGAHMVAIAASESFGPDEIRTLAWKLEGSGVAIALVPALTDVAGPRIHIRPVAGLPLMYVEEPVFKGPRLILKTVLDFLSAALLVLILSPLLVCVAIAIKISDRGPVFYRQERVGFAGRRFRVWKFRSMMHGADKKIDQAKATANQQNDVFYKSASDSRITPIGRLLRRTSIDELPQLFNVLLGNMSMVGPRPHATATKAAGIPFEEAVSEYSSRHRVKPGITGWAQINGYRGETDTLFKIQKRVEYDLEYIAKWSVWFDLYIVFMTVPAVLSTKEVY